MNSGRRGAFTTLEVLDDVLPAYRESGGFIYDPSAPSGYRSPRYEGVFVARYDQTNGTGIKVRLGPALYNRDNPDFLRDVGSGNDDYSLIPDGGERDIGGGVTVAVSRNRDGSYEVTVAGGRRPPSNCGVPRSGFSRATRTTPAASSTPLSGNSAAARQARRCYDA